MITRPLVLILGAGASKPYGFPLGQTLVSQALKAPNIGKLRTPLEQHRDITPEQLTTFCGELRASLAPSIDAFLETRGEFEDVGKTLIALLLIQHEEPAQLYHAEHDPDNKQTWYQYLFNLMRTDNFAHFAQNRLAIITYNYDRSLEYCLLQALQASYGESEPDCRQMLSAIPIVYVHGCLGRLRGGPNDSRDYRPAISQKTLEVATRGIRIVHEVDDNDPQFKRARDLIRDAEHVIFLGFGYYHKNVERLKLPAGESRSPRLWGTAHGFTQSEAANDIQAPISQLRGRNLTFETVLEFLRNHRELFL